MKKKYIILLHILFWGYYFLQELVIVNHKSYAMHIPIFSLDIKNPEIGFLYSFNFLYLFIFYLNYLFVLPKFFDATKFGRMLLVLCMLFGLFILLRYTLEEVLYYQIFGYRNYNEGTTLVYYIYDNLHYGSRPIVASSVLWFIVNLSRLQAEKIELIESKRETEINFLKSQINPHFIFNTLNNIYYLVFEKSEKSLKAIEQLSSLMRYMTYESQNNTIAIQREIDYIENFIALESMRISGATNILFHTEIQNPEYRIPPLLLIPFIENGFKHGVVNNPEQPFEIKLIQTESHLELQTTNLINDYKKDSQSGVGIENVKKRLQLYYPNKHILEITVYQPVYKTLLRIDL